MSPSMTWTQPPTGFKRLGGAVYVPPTDSNIGRISVVADPQTATLALVKGLKARPAGAGELGRAGARRLARVARRRLEEGIRLLRRVFSAGGRRTPNPVRRTVSAVLRGGQTIGGMFTKRPQEPIPFWLYYFNVERHRMRRCARRRRWRPSLRGTARIARQQLGCPVQGSSRHRICDSGQAKPGCPSNARTRLVHRVGRVFIAGRLLVNKPTARVAIRTRKSRINRSRQSCLDRTRVDQPALAGAGGAFGSGLSCRFDQEM